MPKIKQYIVKFFGEKDGDIELSQEDGQALVIYLAENPDKRFVMINGNLKNIASIKSIDEDYVSQLLPQNDGSYIRKYEERELTSGEIASQDNFDGYFNKKLLN